MDLPSHVVHDLRLELMAKLALAVVLGGLIGFEREWKGKAAGLRTNILICMAAVLFTEISYRSGISGGDPGRIAAQILTGVGFLGAGTILHHKGSVSGLTSAATIWMVTAIGMTLGWGAYVDAIAATVFVLVVLAGLQRLEVRIQERRPAPRAGEHPAAD